MQENDNNGTNFFLTTIYVRISSAPEFVCMKVGISNSKIYILDRCFFLRSSQERQETKEKEICRNHPQGRKSRKKDAEEEIHASHAGKRKLKECGERNIHRSQAESKPEKDEIQDDIKIKSNKLNYGIADHEFTELQIYIPLLWIAPKLTSLSICESLQSHNFLGVRAMFSLAEAKPTSHDTLLQT